MAVKWSSANLRRFRERHGLSQPRMADIMDVSLRCYRNWEAGRSKPICADLIMTGLVGKIAPRKIDHKELRDIDAEIIDKIVRALGQSRYHLVKYNVNHWTKHLVDEALTLIQEKL